MTKSRRDFLKAATVAAALRPAAGAEPRVPKWTRFEATFTSSRDYEYPLETDLRVSFRAPSGAVRVVPGFWDGGRTWRVRFSPNETGRWIFATECSDAGNGGLHGRRGALVAEAPRAGTIFERHGPIQVAAGGRHLAHEDGTPFFWLGDTAWNGPMFATPEEWDHYVRTRGRQRFNVIQWVGTQWRGAPEGDSSKRLAYTGLERIQVNPEFFQRLDAKHDVLVRAGMLSVPVMLWAIATPPGSEVNPGVSLPEEQAIRLARYMLARWGADPVAWFLAGDGEYRGRYAAKWKAIGRGVFEGVWHAPATLHPGGRKWVMDDFRDEPWMDICGYQSAHGDSDGNSQWITMGPPAEEWKRTPPRPVMSIEAPYERADPPNGFLVRRNHWWSLLNAHVAGITYGVHGVWGWSDGVNPAAGHGKEVAPRWDKLLDLPGARYAAIMRDFFESIEYWRLKPAPDILAEQPGKQEPRRFISVAQTDKRDITVVYVPEDRRVPLKEGALPARHDAVWIKPETGERSPARGFETPGPGDWVLLVRSVVG